MYQYLLLLDTDQERDFFQMLYDRYKNDMYYTAYRILQNRADAEDIVHETFLTLTENLVKIMGDPPQKNRNYILTIVKNKCYNLYKKKKREIDADMEQERPDLVFPEGLDERLERMEKKELIMYKNAMLQKRSANIITLNPRKIKGILHFSYNCFTYNLIVHLYVNLQHLRAFG